MGDKETPVIDSIVNAISPAGEGFVLRLTLEQRDYLVAMLQDRLSEPDAEEEPYPNSWASHGTSPGGEL